MSLILVMFVCSRTKKFITLIANLCIILNQWVLAGDGYCDMHSCGNKPHTMCRYSNSGASSNCEKYDPAPLNNDERNSIVNRHNELRKKIAAGNEKRGKPGPQPSALDMTMLEWDDELANVAQRWADQCTKGHDECRDVDRFKVGQNIATAWSTGKINKKLEDMVDDWYNEVRFFNKYYVGRYKFGMKWGHYSQVVWAKTSKIGCGRVLFWDNGKRMNTMRLICNYGPAGNYRYEPVYTASSRRPALNRFILFTVVVFYQQIYGHLPV